MSSRPKRLHGAAFALACWAASALAAVAQVAPFPPAHAPPPGSPGAIALREARLAIARAAATNPAAAQRATFAYQRAATSLSAGDTAGALRDAAEAQALAGAPPPRTAPRNGQPLPAVNQPALDSGFSIYPSEAEQTDADEFVARARDATDACAAHHPARLADAKARFGRVIAARDAGNLVKERAEARELIERCGAEP